MTAFGISRVFRFNDGNTGAAQISVFPEAALSNETLGDELLDVDINWEHFVASTNDKLIPGDPLKVSDAPLQRKIEALDELSEALVGEINQRSQEHTASRKRIKRLTQILIIVAAVAVLIVWALVAR